MNGSMDRSMMRNPAISRSAIQRNHALITPESHVQSPLPGWEKSKAIILIAPPMGARFVQYIAVMEAGGAGALTATVLSRFLFVLEGEVTLTLGEALGETQRLTVGSFVYLPPTHDAYLEATVASRVLVFEKPYVPLLGVAAPEAVIGNEAEIAAQPFLGDEGALLKNLLPSSPAFDFEINVFTFAPGGSLPLVEVHVMEHGVIFLAGQGIYRLDDQWYPVVEGDVIWMGPFCPQWFAAIGKTPARYLYYKDVNRHPLAANLGGNATEASA